MSVVLTPHISEVNPEIEAEYTRRLFLYCLPMAVNILVGMIFGAQWLLSLLLIGPICGALFLSTRDRAKELRWRYKHIARLHNWAVDHGNKAFLAGQSSHSWMTWSEYAGPALNWYPYWDNDNGEWWRDLKAFAAAQDAAIETAAVTAIRSAMFMNTYASNHGWYNVQKRPRW